MSRPELKVGDKTDVNTNSLSFKDNAKRLTTEIGEFVLSPNQVILDKAVELSSMGIRVDEKSLISQLEKSGCLDRLKLLYHQKIEKCELPYTIGGGIGQSRILMLLLEKYHIAEIQASSWETKTLKELKDKKVL